MWKLVDSDGNEVVEGQLMETFRGDEVRVCDGVGRPPHKPSSSGFVWISNPGGSMKQECYAGVIGCKWVEV